MLCVRLFLYWYLHWFCPLLKCPVLSLLSLFRTSFYSFGGTQRPISTLNHHPPSPLPLSLVRRGAFCSPRVALHLSASMATLAFCSAPAWEFTPMGQVGQGCVGGCPWVQSPCGGDGTLGTFGDKPQPPTCEGGGEVAMDAAIGLPPLLLLKLSDALSLENIVSASGKLGGVAGVLAGVHIWGRNERNCKPCYLRMCHQRCKYGEFLWVKGELGEFQMLKTPGPGRKITALYLHALPVSSLSCVMHHATYTCPSLSHTHTHACTDRAAMQHKQKHTMTFDGINVFLYKL